MIGYPLNFIKLQAFIISIFLILSEGVFCDNFLTAARMSDSDKATRFVFEFKNNVTYKVIELVEPARLVIDFAKSDLSTNLSNLDISGTNILKIRTSKKKFGDLRLVLDLKNAMRFQHFLLNSAGSEKTRFVIDFFKARVNEERISKSYKTSKRKILIAIDAGHGGKDPGALGPGKIQEKHIVLSISKKIERLFDQDPSFDGFLTRDGDYFLDHRKRSRLAFDKRADFFVSIHADAFPDSRANGASVYVLSTEGSESEVGKFFTAKKKVEEHIKKARDAGTDDLLAGSALEEAITIDQQEERIEKMMEKIRDHYMRKGQTHRWTKIKAEAAKIEKKREIKRKANAAARVAAKKEEQILIEQLAKMVLGLVVTVIVIAGMVFLIFGSGAE